MTKYNKNFIKKILEEIENYKENNSFDKSSDFYFAKTIWGITHHKTFFPQDQDPLEDKIKFLEDSFFYAQQEFEDNLEAKKSIYKLATDLLENKNIDIEIQTYCAKTKKWCLEYTKDNK